MLRTDSSLLTLSGLLRLPGWMVSTAEAGSMHAEQRLCLTAAEMGSWVSSPHDDAFTVEEVVVGFVNTVEELVEVVPNSTDVE